MPLGIGRAACGFREAALRAANMPAAAMPVRMIDAIAPRILCAPLEFNPHVDLIAKEVVLLATTGGQASQFEATVDGELSWRSPATTAALAADT